MSAKRIPPSLKTGAMMPVTGGRPVEWVREESGEHAGNAHFRTVDSLGLLLRNGTITPPMHDAGQQFAATFVWAQLHGPRALALDRVRGGQWSDGISERAAYARKRIGEALDAVGGIGSPGGTAVWHVAGLGQSLKEWSAQQGWNGRALSQPEARGILIAALGMLAMHYGYLRAVPAKPLDR